MGRVSGGLWILGAALGVAGAFLPGASHQDIAWVLALSGVVLAYGIASVSGAIPWYRTSITALGVGTALTIPVVGLAIYLTGGSISYIEPLLVCSLLYIAFFFPPAWAWPLAVELVLIAGSPLLYEDPTADAFVPRFLSLATGILAVTGVMIALKRRLVEAEARQREIAHRDSLTAVANRRAFDARLRKELDSRLEPSGGRRGTDSEPLALLLVDLDDFKSINDRHGHQIGDAVLRQTAERVHAVLRSTDMLARIGGDEFAVIAPGAHGEGAVGLAEAIRTAVAAAEPGSKVPLPRVSVGLATFPEDGIDYETLMASADRRLLRVKGNGTRPAARRGSESGLRLI